MSRRVSPVFALIVIVVVLGFAALWFMTRYRAHEAREAELSRALQQQAYQAIRSGRRGQMMQRSHERRQRRGDRAREGEFPRR